MEQEVKAVSYGGMMGLLWRKKSSIAVYLPHSPDSIIDALSSNPNFKDYEIEKEGSTTHFHHKNPLAPLSYLRISEDHGDSVLYLPSSEITDKKLQELLPIEISDTKDLKPTDIKTFRELLLLERHSIPDDRLVMLIEKAIVPMPKEDKSILEHVLELAGIKEKDIKPYEIYYKLSYTLDSPAVSEPWRDEAGVYSRAIRFPCPSMGIPIVEMDKKWGLGFSIGCFYKRYEDGSCRALSDYILAYYTKYEDLFQLVQEGASFSEMLQENQLKDLTFIPVLKVLKKIWEKRPEERLEAVRTIWAEDFSLDDSDKALSLI